MAKKPSPVLPEESPSLAIDPEAFYRVRVRKVVTAAGVKFLPRADEYVVRGAVVPALGDAILSIEMKD